MKDEEFLNHVKDTWKEPEEKPPILKKIAVVFMALFLILLIVSYIPGGYKLYNFVTNIFVSKTISPDQLSTEYETTTITFTGEVYNKLYKRYLEHQQAEFAACLQGTITDTNYHITSLYFPEPFSESVFSVTAEECSQDTIIWLHTHPLRRCTFSETDINSYKKLLINHPNLILALMCEPTRFTFYRE